MHWRRPPLPLLHEATDALVRVTRTTICGTDLYILKGDVPTVGDGRFLGHEGIGVIEAIGSGITRYKKGDRVLISCITACGRCEYFRRGMCSHCESEAWILGNTIDGTQGEFVRIPMADTSLHPLPDDADEEAMVMLSDILPTGYECGVLNGCVNPGDAVAIIGAEANRSCRAADRAVLRAVQPHHDRPQDNRLDAARKLGTTHLINNTRDKAVEKALAMTRGKGVDVAIEAVGVPDTFIVCQGIIAPRGHVANVGVHGESVPLHL